MTSITKKLWKSALILFIALGVMSCKKDDDDEMTTSSKSNKDIVDVALSNPEFDSLVVALTEADLVSTFQGKNSGPFTVFAPTNTAFVNLLSDLKLNSISEIDKDLLTTVLTYHVVSGEVKAKDLTDGMLVKTLQGNTFTINTVGAVTIDVNAGEKTDIVVTEADVDASNGVIHVVNTVLVPDSPTSTPTDDIIEIALANGFDSLAVALTDAGLVSTFQGDESGPFTVFAPTNAAFVNLLSNLNLNSIAEIEDATLLAVLKAHVVDGVFQSSQISNGKTISTLGGAPISFDTSSGVSVSSDNTSSSDVSTADFWATNGVIHIISEVLVP